jgi:3-methyladenine DNA glycosylase AlkD
MPLTAKDIHKALAPLASKSQAQHAQRFFKTGRGEYAEGDRFLGIRVPQLRRLVGRFRGIALAEILALLKSPWHEERLLALLMLVDRYTRGDAGERARIYNLYRRHTKYINNWDLVDSSAPYILGAHLMPRDKQPLYRMARSKNLWQRRIAVLATFYMIKHKACDDALAIALILKDDREDLIHKAVGWMLREIGKRHPACAERFLQQHHKTMPRTMLRYAIERLPQRKRKVYLQGQR